VVIAAIHAKAHAPPSPPYWFSRPHTRMCVKSCSWWCACYDAWTAPVCGTCGFCFFLMCSMFRSQSLTQSGGRPPLYRLSHTPIWLPGMKRIPAPLSAGRALGPLLEAAQFRSEITPRYWMWGCKQQCSSLGAGAEVHWFVPASEVQRGSCYYCCLSRIHTSS